MEAAVQRAGFSVAEPVPSDDPVERERLRRKAEVRKLSGKFALAAVAAVVTMIGSMPLMAGMEAKEHDLVARLMAPLNDTLAGWLPALYTFGATNPEMLKLALMLITLPVLLWSGQQFFKGASSGLKHRSADMNTLIAVGTGAAFLYSLVATLLPWVFSGAGLPADVYYEGVNAIISPGTAARGTGQGADLPGHPAPPRAAPQDRHGATWWPGGGGRGRVGRGGRQGDGASR
jgi:Cu+-exporting ATPase